MGVQNNLSSLYHCQASLSGMSAWLQWLHHDVVLASRSSYPALLMIGFNMKGCLFMFNERSSKFEHKRAPHVEFLVGFLCYTYPGSILVDIIFRKSFPGCMTDTTIIVVY